VRAWVVSHGPETVSRITADADSLVELAWDLDNAVGVSDGSPARQRAGRLGAGQPGTVPQEIVFFTSLL